jgi:hypothetical protein
MNQFEHINSPLAQNGRELPFQVPDGYFDKLPTLIQEKCISHSHANEPKVAPAWQVIKSQLALAVGFVAFALVAFTGYYFLQPSSEPGSLSNGEYIEIVKKQIYHYDEAIITSEASRTSISYDSVKNDYRDDMIQYLLDENIDYVTLIEQY